MEIGEPRLLEEQRQHYDAFWKRADVEIERRAGRVDHIHSAPCFLRLGDEADHDLHLVIADSADRTKTMIAGMGTRQNDIEIYSKEGMATARAGGVGEVGALVNLH